MVLWFTDKGGVTETKKGAISIFYIHFTPCVAVHIHTVRWINPRCGWHVMENLQIEVEYHLQDLRNDSINYRVHSEE